MALDMVLLNWALYAVHAAVTPAAIAEPKPDADFATTLLLEIHTEACIDVAPSRNLLLVSETKLELAMTMEIEVDAVDGEFAGKMLWMLFQTQANDPAVFAQV